jgi:MFS family permease
MPVQPQLETAPLAEFLAKRGIHYGWIVAAVTFLTMLVTAGAVGAPGVLIGPLQTEFGWDTADISSAFAVRLLLFGLVGPFAAAFMNQFGIRRMTVIALTMIALGVLGSFYMSKLWHLVLLWGVVVGLGTGLTALVLGATVATRWFSHRRGLVMGLLTASSATGQLVFLPVLAQLSAVFGWRTALVVVLAMLFLTALLVLALMRDRPVDLGLPPYGAADRVASPPRAASFGATLASPVLALREAAQSRSFWVLFGTFFICGASTNGLVQTHFIAMCGDFGLTAVMAAGLLAVVGVFDLVGTIGSGWLSDRFDSRWLLFWYYALRGLSLLYLPFTGFGPYGLSVFVIFYGLDWVATVPPTVKLVADRFEGKAPLVFGWIFTGHQLGAACAAYGAGLSRTLYDTYLPAFFVAGVLCIFAAIAIITIREPNDARQPAHAA